VLETLPRVKNKERWTWEKCVEALADYLRELGADDTPSEHHYQTICVRRDWPASSTIIRKAPWSAALDAARVLVITGERVPLAIALGQRSGASS
jgi:hypothetical protein